MAFEERNAAYDISLFEAAEEYEYEERKKATHRKKRNNLVSIPEEQLNKARRPKRNPLKLAKYFMVGALLTGTVALIIHGQVQLTELNQKISNAEVTLANQESLYTQTKMKVEAKISPSVVEKFATEELGMVKADAYQKEYIKFTEGDKAEVSNPESVNIFESIAQSIADLW